MKKVFPVLFVVLLIAGCAVTVPTTHTKIIEKSFTSADYEVFELSDTTISGYKISDPDIEPNRIMNIFTRQPGRSVWSSSSSSPDMRVGEGYAIVSRSPMDFDVRLIITWVEEVKYPVVSY